MLVYKTKRKDKHNLIVVVINSLNHYFSTVVTQLISYWSSFKPDIHLHIFTWKLRSLKQRTWPRKNYLRL